VRAIDVAGNIQNTVATGTFVLDTAAPDTTITRKPSSPSASGTATFEFTGNDGIGTGATSFQYRLDGGDFITTTGALTLTGLAEGSHTLEVRAVDGVNLVDPTPATYTWIVDSVAPDAPSAPDLVSASDSGKLDTDNVTSVTTPTFAGTAEDGATVRLYDGERLLGSAVAVSGAWTIMAATLGDGEHTITATATDAAGNTSVASAGLTVTIDTAAPAAPKISLMHDTGVSSTDKVTGDPALTVLATNASYQLNGGSAQSALPVFATDGTADGQYSITVQDTDAAGNVSTSSLTFVLDTTAPQAQDGAAKSGSDDTIRGHLAAADNLSTALTYSLVGQAAHGTVTLASDGTFVYKPDLYFSGTDTFTFKANDGVNDSNVATMTMNVTAVHVIGTPGDDSFPALPGFEYIDAIGGTDTVAFDFKLTDANISFAGNNVIVDGPGGSHTVLTGVEVYKFADGTVNNADGSWLVDDLFYYSQNHDVWTAHVDADQHYREFGWREGRDPDAFFSTSTYLSLNPSLKSAGSDLLAQFDLGGWKTSAPSINFDSQAYLAANPDVKAAGVDPLAHFLQFGAGEGRQPFALTELVAPNGFDYVYYLQHNPDVAAAHVDAFQHYETIGWKEGRNPNAWFDDKGYLTAYGDVAKAGINPLDHYNVSGWKEGRDPSVNFDTQKYLAANPDVAAAHVNPLTHYLQHGVHEGRSPFADGVWGH